MHLLRMCLARQSYTERLYLKKENWVGQPTDKQTNIGLVGTHMGNRPTLAAGRGYKGSEDNGLSFF